MRKEIKLEKNKEIVEEYKKEKKIKFLLGN